MNNYSCPPNKAQSNSRFLPQDYSPYHAQAQQAYSRPMHERPPGQLRMPLPYDTQSQWNTHEVNNYLLQHQAPPPPPPPPSTPTTTPSTSAPAGTRRRSSRFDLRPDDRRERRRFHDQNGASLPPPQRPTVLPQSSNPTPPPHANGTHRTSSAPSGDVSLHPRGSPPPPQLPFPRRRPLTTNYPEYPAPYQMLFQQTHGQHTRSQNSHRPSHPSQHQDYRQKQIETTNKQSPRRQFTQKPPHHQHQVQHQSLVQQHKQESSKDHRDYQKRSSPPDRNHRRDDPSKGLTPKHHRSGSRFGQPSVINNVQRTPPTDNVSDKVITSPPSEPSDARGEKRSPNLKEAKIQEAKVREEKKAEVQPRRRKLKTITAQHMKRLKKSDSLSYYLAKELERRKRITSQNRLVQPMRKKDQLSSSGKSSLSAALRHFSAIVEQIVTEGNWAYTSPTVGASEKDTDKTSPNKNVRLRKRKVVKKDQNVRISTPATISAQTESGKNLQPLPLPSTSKHPDKARGPLIEKPNGTKTQQSQTTTDPNPFFNFDATAFDINFDGLNKTENDKDDDVDVDMESPISENDDEEILEDALKLDEEKADAQQDPRVIPRNLIASSAEVEEKKPLPPPPVPRGKAKPKSKLKKKGKKPSKPSQKMTMTWVGVIITEMTKPKELRAEYVNEIMHQTQRLMNHFADRWEEFEQMFEENQDPQISERGQMLIKLFSAVRQRQGINWRIFEDETPPDSHRSFKKFAKKAVAGELAKALTEHEPEMFDFSPFAKYMDPKDVLVANPELEGSFYNRLYAPQFYGFDDGSVGPYFDPKRRPKRKPVEENAKGATNATEDGNRKVRVSGKRKRLMKYDRVMRKRAVRGHVRSSEIRRIPPTPPPRPKYEGMKKNEIPLHEKISRHPKSKFCPNFNWSRCPTTECVLTHQCSCCDGNHPACLCPAACIDWNAGFDDCKAKGKDHVKKHRCVICGKSNGTHRGVRCPLINPHVAHQVAQAAKRKIRQRAATLRSDQWRRQVKSKSAVDAAIQRGGYASLDKNPCFNQRETASLNSLRKIYGAVVYKTKALRYGPGTYYYKKGVDQIDSIRKLNKRARGKRKRKVNQRSVVGVKRGIGETQEPKPPERGRQTPACHGHANERLWPSPKKKARIEVKHS